MLGILTGLGTNSNLNAMVSAAIGYPGIIGAYEGFLQLVFTQHVIERPHKLKQSLNE